MNHQNDLIDTTEMYLRTVLELEEEGIIPLRARIAERLGHSGPTVSQTIARMQRDQLVAFSDDRPIRLTRQGRLAAVRVMRKHRLAECLLADVIGLDWHLVHDEACRWEHVMSESVERRLLDILGHPARSPYGNPIPGLAELGDEGDGVSSGELIPLSELPETAASAVIRRIGEPLQSDTILLARLDRAGSRPGAAMPVTRADGRILIGTGREAVELDLAAAAHVFVTWSPDLPRSSPATAEMWVKRTK
jgi:DtxR family transcriptional regulator, Mn-dependent transcriptional regulator